MGRRDLRLLSHTRAEFGVHSYKMSTQTSNGRKPASAATNLIGMISIDSLAICLYAAGEEKLNMLNFSRRWRRHDGSSCLPSVGYVETDCLTR